MVGTFGTDSGMCCAKCGMTLWTFEVDLEDQEDGLPLWVVTAKCASCKHVEGFATGQEPEDVQDLKVAHWATRAG